MGRKRLEDTPPSERDLAKGLRMFLNMLEHPKFLVRMSNEEIEIWQKWRKRVALCG